MCVLAYLSRIDNVRGKEVSSNKNKKQVVQHLTSRNTRLVEAVVVVVGRHCRNTHIIKNRILKVTSSSSSSSNLLSLRLVAIRDILYNNNINIITIDRSRAP